MRPKLLVLALTLMLAVVVAVMVIPRAVSTEPRGPTRWSLDEARAFRDFPVYYLGDSFGATKLNTIFRVNALALPGETTRRNDVSFIYGSCENQNGSACLPPIQVQVWDACQRYPALYPFEPEQSLRLRGVPAAIYDGGRRLELSSGPVTVVIFGQDPARVHDAVNALRGVNNAIAPLVPLPPPVKGALERRQCN